MIREIYLSLPKNPSNGTELRIHSFKLSLLSLSVWDLKGQCNRTGMHESKSHANQSLVVGDQNDIHGFLGLCFFFKGGV